MEGTIILLIDGECNLCHWITRFVVKRDKRMQFRFASLQSEVGVYLLERGSLPIDDMDTFVMVEGDTYYTKSDAALRVLQKLKTLWPVPYGAVLVPRFLRDWFYDGIAGSRYRMFGKRDACLLPTPEIQSRFIIDIEEVKTS